MDTSSRRNTWVNEGTDGKKDTPQECPERYACKGQPANLTNQNMVVVDAPKLGSTEASKGKVVLALGDRMDVVLCIGTGGSASEGPDGMQTETTLERAVLSTEAPNDRISLEVGLPNNQSSLELPNQLNKAVLQESKAGEERTLVGNRSHNNSSRKWRRAARGNIPLLHQGRKYYSQGHSQLLQPTVIDKGKHVPSTPPPYLSSSRTSTSCSPGKLKRQKGPVCKEEVGGRRKKAKNSCSDVKEISVSVAEPTEQARRSS